MTKAEAFRQRLSLLDARLRNPEVAAIAGELGAATTLEAERTALIGLLEANDAALTALEADTADTVAAHAADSDPRHVTGWLDRRAGGRAAWRDRRAVGRTLGIAVIRERAAMAVESLGIREELLLKLLIEQLDAAAPAPETVTRRLVHARRWHARLAAAEVLVSHARAGGRTPGAEALVHARATTPGEHPWVCDACDAYLVALDRERGVAHLKQALTEGAARAREGRSLRIDFLLRRLRVERLARVAPEQAGALLGALAHDPSEHVTLGIVAELARIPTDAARAALSALATDPRPRVRLAVGEHVRRNPAVQDAAWLSATIEARLVAESDAEALRSWCRAAAAVAEQHPLAAPALYDALDHAVHRDLSGDSVEAAAAARAVCARVQDAAAQALYTALHAHLPRITPGSAVRLRWSELGQTSPCSPEQLGSVLAELTREDHGVNADLNTEGVRLWRGDRFTPRPWRVLHELRHPAPNKRQGGNHIIGRRVRGALRAPSARMAEVTATTVPGERTVVDREGSWVPMLPTVDDLLDLGSGTTIYSAYGRTTLRPPSALLDRLLLKAKLTLGYARYAQRRTMSIGADEPSERGAYLRDVERDLGVTVQFTPTGTAPRRIQELATGLGTQATLSGLLDTVLTPTRASQPALAAFAATVLGVMLTEAYVRRDRIRADREAIPLVIGGWGTRGKSGTERIKAALFHGLGHPVFVKTTGCEAMFIHASPGTVAREVFIYRPHDKSSIWEQAAMLRQASGMHARVMLWECMALRPAFVEVLEQEWMRDDLVTITNAFPDHEDIQGPAGRDIATTISSFVPQQSTAFTSEVEFLPLLRDRAIERGSTLTAIDPVEAELWGSDLLALFPYQEHPRNIALVARMAEHLGIDRHLAVMTMAEGVVPDLGVLRIYPEVQVRGRALRFINGMSANERTGCVANWRRTGCDTILPDTHPDHAIVVVVNNRADRVARSEVFARILVQDLSADAFVLIGTNLTGLHGYIQAALTTELQTLRLQPEGTTPEQALERLAGWFARLRIARPTRDAAIARAVAAAHGAGATLNPTAALDAAIARWLNPTDTTLDRAALEQDIAADAALREAFLSSADSSADSSAAAYAEQDVLVPPDLAHAYDGWRSAFADLVLHARARARLAASTLDDPTFRAVYRARFFASLRPIADRYATGDQIIAAAADAAMPGTRVTVMGVQNIKGTGLDFAYRWVALGQVSTLLERARTSANEDRATALRALLTFDDYGLVDSGTAAIALRRPLSGETVEQAALREQVVTLVTERLSARRVRLAEQRTQRWWMSVLDVVEMVLEPLDAIGRAWAAHRTMRQLRDHTIALPEAAARMQDLYARQKGGWLVKWALSR